MDAEEILATLVLNATDGLGPHRISSLIEKFGSAKEAVLAGKRGGVGAADREGDHKGDLQPTRRVRVTGLRR